MKLPWYSTGPGNARQNFLLAMLFAIVQCVPIAQAQTDSQRGAQAFRLCIACHSLEPGRHLTGPSLGNLWERKAGTVSGFQRYSDAIKRSNVIWNEQSLDQWLKNPGVFIPGNAMNFPGIKEDAVRRDLIAYLKIAGATQGKRPAMPRIARLKNADADSTVKALRHCGDTYFVTTEDGTTHKIWEFDLRLKTDTSDYGPASGKPVIIGAGMRGDRASIVFSSTAELSSFIKEQCE